MSWFNRQSEADKLKARLGQLQSKKEKIKEIAELSEQIQSEERQIKDLKRKALLAKPIFSFLKNVGGAVERMEAPKVMQEQSKPLDVKDIRPEVKTVKAKHKVI